MNTPQGDREKKQLFQEHVTENPIRVFPAAILLSPEYALREKEMRELFTQGRTVVLGDLHGNIDSLKEHMYLAGVTSREGKICTSGGRTLIFLGDIVADRNQTGLTCLTSIYDLRAAGYDVHVLAGNHDVWMVDYLFKKQDAQLLTKHCFPDQGQGLAELLQYHPKLSQVSKEYYAPYAAAFLEAFQEDIVQAVFLSDHAWLEELLHMKFFRVDVRTKTLFLHTPPTPSICAVVASCIHHQRYDYSIKDALTEKYYEQMRDIFCYTNNRIGKASSPHNEVTLLRRSDISLLEDSGIKRIMVGHDTIEDCIDVTSMLGTDLLGSTILYNVDGGAMKDTRFEEFQSLRSLLVMDDESKILSTKRQYTMHGFEGTVVL